MEVILLENVRNLGKIGNRVVVKPGYARNFLIPYGKAIVVNKTNLAKFESQKEELEKRALDELNAAKVRAENFAAVNLIVPVKATDDGKLFGSVGVAVIAEAFVAQGLAIKKNEISLPQGVIRQLGTYEVVLMLHSEVTLKVKVSIVNEK